MKIHKKLLTLAIPFFAFTSSAVVAQPTLNSTYEGRTPDGNNAFLFEIASDDLNGSYGIELGFSGATINNSVSSASTTGSPDTFAEAMAEQEDTDIAAGSGTDTGFSILEDTYYFASNFTKDNPGNNPFTGTTTEGFVQSSPSTLFLSFGTGTGLGASYSVVRIVTPDSSINYQGVIAQAGVNNLISGMTDVIPPVLAGDYDNSGLVGSGDLGLVLTFWGALVADGESPDSTWVNADDIDGPNIGSDELGLVLANWGNSTDIMESLASITATTGLSEGQVLALIPEPGTLVVMAAGTLGLIARRRRAA